MPRKKSNIRVQIEPLEKAKLKVICIMENKKEAEVISAIINFYFETKDEYRKFVNGLKANE